MSKQKIISWTVNFFHALLCFACRSSSITRVRLSHRWLRRLRETFPSRRGPSSWLRRGPPANSHFRLEEGLSWAARDFLSFLFLFFWENCCLCRRLSAEALLFDFFSFLALLSFFWWSMDSYFRLGAFGRGCCPFESQTTGWLVNVHAHPRAYVLHYTFDEAIFSRIGRRIKR